jgi:hypothetical protein
VQRIIGEGGQRTGFICVVQRAKASLDRALCLNFGLRFFCVLWMLRRITTIMLWFLLQLPAVVDT